MWCTVCRTKLKGSKVPESTDFLFAFISIHTYSFLRFQHFDDNFKIIGNSLICGEDIIFVFYRFMITRQSFVHR